MTRLLLVHLSTLLLLSLSTTRADESCNLSDDPTCSPTGSPLEKASHFHDFIAHVFDKVDAHAATLEKPNLREQERLILTWWLEYLNMDANTLLSQSPLESNWLYEVYQATKNLAPPHFFKVWDERARPTDDEIRILLSIDDSPYQAALQPDGNVDENTLMNHLFMSFRHRGFQMSLLDTFTRVLLGPLKTISYAIPSPQNLQAIASYAPLVEVGAGTGYWSAALQTLGVEIAPYDSDPPSPEKKGLYFDHTYTPVQEQTCQSLFDDAETANNRTLLMVWSNNPDNVDNAEEFHSNRLPPVWDVDCLEAFVKAGGTTLIVVAEREANIHVLPNHPQNPTQPDSGLCASRQFQRMLKRDFELIHQMPIPTWYYSDDLTIWRLKTSTEEEE